MSKYVAVIGPGADATNEDLAAARCTGRLLADAGIIVINGGLQGVMAATAEGTQQAGGVSLGLLPGSDRQEANQYLTLAIPTGFGELRNGLIIRSADAVIAIGGSWGTLNEVALALRLERPIICLNGWRLADSAGNEIEIPRAENPRAAVDWVLARVLDDC